MGQPLNYLFQNDLAKVSGRELAYKEDKYNFVKRRISEMRCVVSPINLPGIGDENEYAFR
jgi:hypothetical protein